MTLRIFRRTGGSSGRGWWRAIRRDEAGSSLIELALLLPIFATILVGSVEVAQLAYASIEVTNAARAGAEYGAQTHDTAVDSTGMQNVATAAGPNVGNMQATATTFCTCSDGVSITCANAGTSCSARINEYVQVNTSASVTSVFHIAGLPRTITLKGVAVQRVEQ